MVLWLVAALLEQLVLIRYVLENEHHRETWNRMLSSHIQVVLPPSRCQLFVRPAGCLDGQYAASSTCVAWKEQVHHSSEVRSSLQCPAADGSMLPLMVGTLAVPDDLRHISSHGEDDWDPAYVIHLHPVATLRNLLPYSVRYMMEVRQPEKLKRVVMQSSVKINLFPVIRVQQTPASFRRAAHRTS